MRTRIKVTSLTESQWHFVQRFACIEYPLDGTAVSVCYEFCPGWEFNTIMPLAKFDEIQDHLHRVGEDRGLWPMPDQGEAKARDILSLIRKISDTIDEMRADLREVTGRG